MFDPSDTIVAVATPPSAWRSIIRMSGPATLANCRTLCPRAPTHWEAGIHRHSIQVMPDLELGVLLYVFLSPRSYTGEDLVELHVTAAPVVVQALVERLLREEGIRRAGPGEFTARAYLHGKLDLAQAEAVCEIVHSTNRMQLEAAQGLLRGRLGATLASARIGLMECLGLLEAGLDFSEEDINFISTAQALERVTGIRQQLQTVLSRGLHDRETIHLPSVGIAGAPNGGKSTLFNALLGQTRSIVSDTQRTTRDVLAARLSLPHGDCLLFDCAGLLVQPDSLLDGLAQNAALASLHRARCVLFCVDVTQADWSEDLRLRHLIPTAEIVLLATKSDLASTDLKERCAALEAVFETPCLPLSATEGHNLDSLIQRLDHRLLGNPSTSAPPDDGLIALTARHRHAIQTALENIDQCAGALQDDLIEVAALLVRTAYQNLSETAQHVDEDILEQVFSRFCIGK